MVASYTAFDPEDQAGPELAMVFAYWQQMKSDRIAPAWSDVDLMQLPPDIIPRVSVVNADVDYSDFSYRFWGTALTGMHHFDLTGKSISKLKPVSYAEAILEQYQSIARSAKPRGFLTEVPMELGRSHYYAVIRMPLSSNGVDIDMVISAEDYGENRDQIREQLEKAVTTP